MLPESTWNSPFVAIEKSRREGQLLKCLLLTELWLPKDVERKNTQEIDSWNKLYDYQNQTLKAALASSASAPTLFNQLQDSAWQYGKSLAENDWPNSVIDNAFDAFLALSTLRIGSLKHSDCFLLERKTKGTCTFYWLSSPIQYPELCMLYHEVFRGYFYQISKNVRAEIHSSILPSASEKVKAWKINLLWID